MKAKRILNTLIIVLSVAFLMSGPSFAKDSKELDEIKHAIQKHGAKWVAGETSVSKLGPEERKNLVMPVKAEEVNGMEPDSNGFYADEVDAMEAAESGAMGSNNMSFSTQSLTTIPKVPITIMPSSLDWRNNKGNWITPIKDQGQCGSCAAFGTTAALESLSIRTLNLPGFNLDLSEKELVCTDCVGCNGGDWGCASNFIRDIGLPSEKCSPYNDSDSCPFVYWCSSREMNRYRIGTWSWVTGSAPTVAALKSALKSGPIVAAMDVFTEFFYYKSGPYVYSYSPTVPWHPEVLNKLEGTHVILIIGYDDNQKCFMVKNSWGTGWGMGGYFNIAYSQVNDSEIKFGKSAISYSNMK